VDGTGTPWVCASGQQQSPINLPAAAFAGGAADPAAAASSSSSSSGGSAGSAGSVAVLPVSEAHATLFELGAIASNGSNIVVANTGHTVQVSWALQEQQGGAAPSISIAVRGACVFGVCCWLWPVIDVVCVLHTA
jgi:hypothetical protein